MQPNSFVVVVVSAAIVTGKRNDGNIIQSFKIYSQHNIRIDKGVSSTTYSGGSVGSLYIWAFMTRIMSYYADASGVSIALEIMVRKGKGYCYRHAYVI